MARLTKRKIEMLKKPGRYGDGHCLFLRVAKGGSKQWVQRITIHGVRRDLGLGSVELLSLEEARVKAIQNRKIARIDKGDPTGGNPTGGSHNSTAPTFRQASKMVHKENLPSWTNSKHGAQWLSTLETYAFPAIGNMRVDAITGADVLKVLKPIWSEKQETARRVRSRIRKTLGWCISHQYIVRNTGNAAGDGIDGALPKQRNGKTHQRALPYQEVAGALQTVEATKASEASKLALRFLVLTAARSGEVRGARWSEIDAEKQVWVIPAERMKAGKEHRQPLSDAALLVLEQAQTLKDGSGLVFPSALKPGRCLSDMTLTKLLRSTGLAERGTVHGFRSSFRTWASECTDADHAVMEKCLAHHVGSQVERAYARSDYREKCSKLMGQWSAFVNGDTTGDLFQGRGGWQLAGRKAQAMGQALLSQAE